MSITASQSALHQVQRLCAENAFDAAAAAGWELLRDDPRDTAVLNLLALTEHRRGNHQAAIVLLQRSIKAEPCNHVSWNDLGNVYYATGAKEDAEAAYLTAVEHNPQCAEAHSNLGVLATARGDPSAARACLDRALALKPGFPDALYNLGNALAAMGKFHKALHRYERAAELRPDHPGTRFNLGITRLLLGDLAGGWPEWEWRWRSTLAPFRRHFDCPEWTGERLDVPGSSDPRRILLYAEQGIGDTLQFLRYVPMVAARGGSIVLEVQRPLMRLLQGYPGIAALVARGDDLPPFDTCCSLMSLAAIFRTTLATVPALDPFLLLPGTAGKQKTLMRVGLAWAGNPTHERDRDRSMPLEALLPLLRIPNVRWVSLQKGEATAALATTPGFGEIPDLGSGFAHFADTAAAIQSLDLVVTVDTSVAHLAGALGKPVWIMLHAFPDWRWLLKRRDSPWYPSARLFRQQQPGHWTTVVHSIAAALSAFTKAA